MAHFAGDGFAEPGVLSPMDGPSLLRGYSLEITAKDAASFEQAAPLLVSGTAVSVTFLPGDDPDMRITTAALVRRLGFEPVPHLSARRLHSEAELDVMLSRLRQEADITRVFVVAGDLPEPTGPYADALAIIRSGMLERHGIRHVGIAGYPEGHPDIPEDRLWNALKDKVAAIREAGQNLDITTQFGFDVAPALNWLERLRQEGVEARVRIGVAGPASVKTLLRFAARCGVAASARVMSRYGASVFNLLSAAGPDRFVAALGESLDPARHGDVTLHFYPFGGVQKTAEWIRKAAR